MARLHEQGDLFPTPHAPDGAVAVSDRCLLRTQNGHRVVVVSGIVTAQYMLGDRMAESHAMVSLIEQGWADQDEVARAFGYSTRTVRRYERRFEAGGLAALGGARGYPKGRRRLPPTRSRLVLRLKAEGLSNREIAHRVGVSENAIRKLLRQLDWVPPSPRQERLPLGSATAHPKLSAFAKAPMEAAPVDSSGSLAGHASLSATHDDGTLPLSLDTDPADRRFDRLLAYLGMLDDAVPLFRAGARVPGAGVLLAMPALAESGVLEIAREVYGSIGPAFYGLRTTLVALLLMALLRIKRPEALKEHPPEDLGRILGLDRAPEVKTVRRKLTRLAALGRAAQFGRALATRRVAARGAVLGFLYVDGHVRVYHGQRLIPKAHVARMRLSMPATSDYWVNDAEGDPLFVVTAEANAGLVKMLPTVLAEIRLLVGERRVTVVFDRGGWSPQLFQRLVSEGFDLLTYRKGRVRRVPKSRFRKHSAVIDGRPITYTLADQGVALLGGKLRLRQVTRLSEDGHQTPIVTTRRDLRAAEVAYRMFERWRQENFFKYLGEEYALDALLDYRIEPDNPARDVPNPVRRALDANLREARAELLRLQADYGRAASANPESRRPTMRGFKIAHGKIGHALRAAMKRVATLEAKRTAVPVRVPVQEAVAGEVVKLAPERKHLTNLLKMVAYQAESDLVRLVAPHYKRTEDEGRTLIQSALASAADIEVRDGELRVLLAPLSSAHRTRAIAALCQELNRTPTFFPGTRLRIRCDVRGPR
ncbi:MAG: helix-turn-helix domain-containing protein [Longimicrobiales bacterium]|nr:helix-turn-helix domain-containing protein [Longimicrobiales bacterium]